MKIWRQQVANTIFAKTSEKHKRRGSRFKNRLTVQGNGYLLSGLEMRARWQERPAGECSGLRGATSTITK